MCEESATAENLRAATPRPVPGSAVDPIKLKPVDGAVVISRDATVTSADRLGIDIDHAGGLAGLAGRRNSSKRPVPLSIT